MKQMTHFLEGESPTLNSLCRWNFKRLFKILGGMLSLVAAFLGLMLLISFSIWAISTVLNEKT